MFNGDIMTDAKRDCMPSRAKASINDHSVGNSYCHVPNARTASISNHHPIF